MKLSSFEKIIRLQFNAYMMITIKGIVRNRRKQRAKRLEREVLFCEILEIKQNNQSNYDSYSFEFFIFQVGNFSIEVSDEKLGMALRKLSEKQRNYILLYYFQDMRDREIAELYHVSRSSVSCTRNRGLKKLKELMNERK
ncbi:sigma-70 family RNA polymerase sigma factor [Sellimonas intestinalis]|uniref:sigma-70 family RNA polymerase sigma factor n=1 Tax=Sellimonas intestinalis TaxID=1653434 RepID=UPI0015EB30E6|nr:sigma-70 family RNA polymerase sigma factor [Sellimonas intestinalis]MBA2212614.1 sigma-70 family RNA polymerase sigma factor [Sellimonas intestinalis]